MIHLICVGKLKNQSYKEIEESFLKRLTNEYVIKIYEVKSHEENLQKESLEVIEQLKKLEKKYPSIKHFALTERGQELNSPKFSKWLSSEIQQASHLSFIIGGASGHGKEVYQRIQGEISLSKMTFPHKISRILFIEQVYRASTLSRGHPYHK